MTRKAVSFEAAGKSFDIALTTNAMARYQDEMGEAATVGFDEIEKAGFDAKRIRALFWAMLPVGSVTIEEAGDLMDDVGIQKAAELIGAAAQAAFPQQGKPRGRKPRS